MLAWLPNPRLMDIGSIDVFSHRPCYEPLLECSEFDSRQYPDTLNLGVERSYTFRIISHYGVAETIWGASPDFGNFKIFLSAGDGSGDKRGSIALALREFKRFQARSPAGP